MSQNRRAVSRLPVAPRELSTPARYRRKGIAATDYYRHAARLDNVKATAK
jgi:hypothetical protein